MSYLRTFFVLLTLFISASVFAEYYDFTDFKDRKLHAAFISYEDGIVTLQTEKGGTKEIPFENLSGRSQTLVRGLALSDEEKDAGYHLFTLKSRRYVVGKYNGMDERGRVILIDLDGKTVYLNPAALSESDLEVCQSVVRPVSEFEEPLSTSYTPSYRSSYTPSYGGTVHVKGYYRKDGTYVQPHTRRKAR